MKPRFSLWERGFFVRRSLSSSITSPVLDPYFRLWIKNATRHGANIPKICTPLTDTAVRNTKPREKTYTLGNGESMYLEVMPNGTKFWRMAYRQPNGR
jgi:hypothetical protein